MDKLIFISKKRIQKIAKENPDLTYEFIKNILIAKQESFRGILKPYKLKNIKSIHTN